ncbi:MAG: flagellar type III secretion system protein FliR [Deferribacteres bacterium]|nr:flagellar type III secretion system protein FliR [candidate division KSB1 bacterium]MCB9501940.1 flagellar type III secretion system protein FliR [Deferribacteres bacterium]
MDALLQQTEVFFLVFVRIFTLFVLIPVFNHRAIPMTVRIALSLVFTVLLVHRVEPVQIDISNAAGYFFLVGKEVLTGIILGFATEFIFHAVRFAGQIISFLMGFSMVVTFDPEMSQEISIISRLKAITAITLFLIIDGHFLLLEALAHSFSVIPLIGMHISGDLLPYIVRLSADVFVIALQISGPILVMLLLTNVGLGILARTVPQMNVFIVGFPLTISVGFFALVFTYPTFSNYFRGLVMSLQTTLGTLLHALVG